MRYCNKFYVVARPLYEALQAACVECYLYGAVNTRYGVIPDVVYTSDAAYTDTVLAELGNVQEFFDAPDGAEWYPWLLCTRGSIREGAIEWAY